MSPAARVVRLACLALAALQLGVLAWLLSHRVRYPFDLEWMEGGELVHALRLLRHEPLYAPPSIDFIPFLYTPLYPAVVAAIARLAGLGYAMARGVSIGSYVLASYLAYRFAARAGGSRAAALAAVAIPAAAFALTGSFYDLARPDSLWLLLATSGFLLVHRAARDADDAPRPLSDGAGHALATAAALAFVLAFFTKQTASPLMVAAAVGLLALNARLAPTFGLALALFGLPSLYVMNRVTHGWFATYVFSLHQGHAFFARRAFVEGPVALAAIVGPALVVIPWALARRSSTALAYAAFVGLAGAFTACLASGTEWAIVNAYIPGVFFLSLAVGVAAGRLVCASQHEVPSRSTPRLRPLVVYGLLGASLALKLPGTHGERDDAFLDLGRARLLHRFDPRRFVPSAADVDAGRALVERLRAAPGDVLVPFHPFYAHLAGKPTFVHQMGVMDVGRAGLPTPAGLAAAFAQRRFSLVVLDDKIAGKWPYWPGLAAGYEERARFVGPRVPSGAQTVPTFAYGPRGAAP